MQPFITASVSSMRLNLKEDQGKPWSEVYESHLRLKPMGKLAKQSKALQLSEIARVNVTGLSKLKKKIIGVNKEIS